MNFINFLNEIDWNKNIIFFIIYMTIILFCISFYFMPVMQSHKLQTLDYKRAQNLNDAINENINKLQIDMDNIRKQNTSLYQNMRNKIDINKLEIYARKYLNNITIQSNEIVNSTNNIEIQSISIKGYANHTKEIIELINNLKELNHSIRIGFPISITKQQDRLKVSLIINIYYSSYNF